MKKNFLIIITFCLLVSCSKKDTQPIAAVPAKCTSSTVLDELLSGKQMYMIATVFRGQVMLSIKDKKAKARAVGEGLVNPIVYEWDIQISKVSDTQVKLVAGEIIAVRGNFVSGVYSPDSFFFNDDKCKITVETNDGQLVTNRLSSYEDITNSKDLATYLEKYLWK
jgi:hypothetical protein